MGGDGGGVKERGGEEHLLLLLRPLAGKVKMIEIRIRTAECPIRPFPFTEKNVSFSDRQREKNM